MYVGTLCRQCPRQLLGTLIACVSLLLAGCATEPPATTLAPTAPPIPTSTTVPRPSTAAPPTPTPTRPTPEPVTSPITATAQLAPLNALRNTRIVDRLPADMRALTDGQVKYRLAAWGPGGDWIAVTPQDGPGLDVVNARTGEVRAVVTDTYVLEPVWLHPATLVLHQVHPTGDQLVRFPIDSASKEPEPLVSVPNSLHAVSAADGTVAYGTPDHRLAVIKGGSPAGGWTTLLNPLVTAAAPHQDNLATVAVTPYVTNLEQVQTVLVQRTADGFVSKPLSQIGEGLWLPRWAPDAKKVALTAIGGRIVCTTVDGQERFDLGPGDSPAWSADSTRIAFAGTSAGEEFISRDIHVVDWRGGGPRLRLTEANDEQFYTSPTWSPDGTRLAFIEIDSGRLFVMDAPRD